MADNKLIDKVKELVDSNANASLKEAAKKWLSEADAKYGDKIDDVLDKLSDSAEKFSEKSIAANEKLTKAGEKFTEGVDKLAEKAGPAFDEFKEKAAPAVENLKSKAAPMVDKVTESEFIKQLKEGVASLDEVIDTFKKPEMKEKVGEEAAEQIRKHAEAMKAEGKTYCDCPACTKAREILRELGADLEEPSAE